MATLTISLTGSAVVTGSKSYTVNDTDLQLLLDWAKATNFDTTATPTNQQVLLAWVQGWINSTKRTVQEFQTPVPPPQIGIN